MDDHPLVHFVDGPAGRRAHLLGTGLDVWEVITVLRDHAGDDAAAAEYLEVTAGLVQAAISYYGVYTDEVDSWIVLNQQDGEAARAASLAGQAALRG